uniref:Uncharacterized protein n=1 Tax=Chromera velia CCMP2878 TaxID=1169474 RepID=A0A0G4HQ85_9ALVE|eukprot:Cvel_30097.t1-p1 / transcript=Cvel_30097.t1 / gene=Cvel_30097 / organism=Chromera_velia_CCMP2878 / gene_product=hypothetical protein / transcript_product=hypothetical protein / location=Cvel_scaffold4240:5558-6483(-) / protein_length=154 / sequence_SO=supercontig / SO=protein_coding / is_pseudo=false
MRAQLLIYEKGVRTRPTDPSGLDSKRDFSRRLALPPQDYSWDLFHPSCKPTEEALAKNAFLREEVLFRRQEGGDWRFKEVVTYILMCLLLENTEEFTEGGGHLNLQDVQSVSVNFKRQPKQDYLQIGIYGVEGPEAKKPNDVLTALWMIHFIYE